MQQANAFINLCGNCHRRIGIDQLLPYEGFLATGRETTNRECH